jgi:hypothetical protein
MKKVLMRGRPVKSKIRDNMVEIIGFLGSGYGYQISKMYNQIFVQVTQRSIYYHLRKGVSTGEIEVNRIVEDSGDFSWGQKVEKIFYSLGPKANFRNLKRVEKFFDVHKIAKNNINIVKGKQNRAKLALK